MRFPCARPPGGGRRFNRALPGARSVGRRWLGSAPQPPLPLGGKLVLTIEQAVAAPYCSSRLADAGARVIKVRNALGSGAAVVFGLCGF